MAHAKTVDHYIASAPAEQRQTLEEIRTMICKHLPDATESIGTSGFAVYTVDGEWIAGFAWRKKGPMLYIMRSDVLDRYSQQLGKLRSGRSCVEWRGNRSLSIDALTELADEMLRQLATTLR